MTEQAQVFTVTHPFHPLNGQQFALIDQGKTWGEDRVYFYDSAGTLRHLPSGWTSVSAADAYATLSAARAHFRAVDLLLLVAFPISATIWTVDLFLIGNLRAQVMGWAAILLNLFLMCANCRIYSPLLVFRSSRKSSFGSKGAGKSP